MKNYAATSNYYFYQDSRKEKRNLYLIHGQKILKNCKNIENRESSDTDTRKSSPDDTINAIIKMFKGTVVNSCHEDKKITGRNADIFPFQIEQDISTNSQTYSF